MDWYRNVSPWRDTLLIAACGAVLTVLGLLLLL